MLPSQLADLRSELRRLVRMRGAVRLASSACTWASATIGVAILLFLIDWAFHLSIEVRRLNLFLGLAAFAFAIKQAMSALLSKRETIEDVALIVEKRHGIDSDLIAALQFEQIPLQSGGSELTQAVIASVVERTRLLNMFDGFTLGSLPARVASLAVATICFVALMTYGSASAPVFMSRLLLGQAAYPTRTFIKSIEINGQRVGMELEAANRPIRIPFGHPVKFDIDCAGEPPRQAFVRLATSQDQRGERVDLKLSPSDRTAVTGELRRMTDSFKATFSIGDATSRPIEVAVVPLPMIEVQSEIIPPKYAQGSANLPRDEKNSNQLSVLNSSTVRLKLTCINKPLKFARLTIADSTFELTAVQEDSQVYWVVPSNTPFESINESFAYEIQVNDEDGLSLARPIAGSVQIKADGTPRIAASAVTQYVLPTAEPKLDFVVTDDFGVSQIDAAIEIQHESGATASFEKSVRTIPEAEQPLVELRGQVSIPLSQYKLSKGDSVKVTPRVTDWRGAQPGQQSTGDSVIFLVTDLEGIFSRVADEDKKAAKQLEEIIKAAGAKP